MKNNYLRSYGKNTTVPVKKKSKNPDLRHAKVATTKWINIIKLTNTNFHFRTIFKVTTLLDVGSSTDNFDKIYSRFFLIIKTAQVNLISTNQNDWLDQKWWEGFSRLNNYFKTIILLSFLVG